MSGTPAISEREVEAYLKDQCKKHSILCYKFISPGNSGVPDRILIHDARVFFVELKRPGANTRPLQKIQIKRIEDHGGNVLVVDSFDGVDTLMTTIKAE